MLRKITPGTLILCLCLICVGCSGKSAQGSQAMPYAKQALPIVNLASPVKSESTLSNQSLELRNCDGKADLHRSLADETQIVCHVLIANNAISTKTGDTIELSSEMKERLAEQVQSAYQQVLEESKIGVEQTDLVVPLSRIRTFKIYWTKQVFSSTISFTMDDEAYTASYTYTLDIPDATVAMETGCTA